MSNGDERRDVKLIYRGELVTGISPDFIPSDDQKLISTRRKVYKKVLGRDLSLCKILISFEDTGRVDDVISMLKIVNVDIHVATPSELPSLSRDGFFGVLTDSEAVAQVFLQRGKKKIGLVGGATCADGCQSIPLKNLSIDVLEKWLKKAIA